MASDDTPLDDPRKVAQRLADGHAFGKHVIGEDIFSGRKNEKYGPELAIKGVSEAESRANFADHLHRTLTDPDTFVFEGVNQLTGKPTREIYHNSKTNTTIFLNKDDPDGGTSVRRELRKTPVLQNLVDQENAVRSKLGLKPADAPRPGGYHVLHPQFQAPHEIPYSTPATVAAPHKPAGAAPVDASKGGTPSQTDRNSAALSRDPGQSAEQPAADARRAQHPEHATNKLSAGGSTTSSFAAEPPYAPHVGPALADGEAALHAATRTLGAAGSVLGPLGLAIDAQTLNQSFHADGNHIGTQTARTASGIAGGWNGAIAGAETGAAIGAAAGSVVPGLGTAAGAAIGGTAGAVAGGITGDWVGRRLFDRVKTMFGSTPEHEPPAPPAKPDTAPALQAPSGTPLAGSGAPSTSSDRIAGTHPEPGAAAHSSSPVEIARTQEAATRATWFASVAGSSTKPPGAGLEHESAAAWKAAETPGPEQIASTSPAPAVVARSRSLRL